MSEEEKLVFRLYEDVNKEELLEAIKQDNLIVNKRGVIGKYINRPGTSGDRWCGFGWIEVNE